MEDRPWTLRRRVNRLASVLVTAAVIWQAAALTIAAELLPSEWIDWDVPTYGFRVQLPAQPQSTVTDLPGVGRQIRYEAVDLDRRLSLVVVCWMLSDAAQQKWPKTEDRLTLMRSRLLSEGRPLDEEATATSHEASATGDILRLESSDGRRIHAQLFAQADRLYRCSISGLTDQDILMPSVSRRFFRSFELRPLQIGEGEFVLHNVEACYGPMGPAHNDLTYRPYDAVEFRALLFGMRTDEAGRPNLHWTAAVVDRSGASVLTDGGDIRELPRPAIDGLPLASSIVLTNRPPPGDYTFTATVEDRLAGRTASFTRAIRIEPADLVIVRVEFLRDETSKESGTGTVTIGGPLAFRCRIAGLKAKDERFAVSLLATLMTTDGLPLHTQTQQVVFRLKQPDETPPPLQDAVPTAFPPGRYVLQLEAVDHVAHRTTKRRLPIEITSTTERN
jgi:hypothetical protein